MRRILGLTLSALALAATACDDPPPPAPAAAAAAKPAAAADAKKPEEKKDDATAKAVEAPPPNEYAYSPVGKRDPFRSILDDLKQAAETTTNAGFDCGPLCKWDLEQLHLVAVVSGLSNPVAMVEDPKGRGYVIRRGTQMGKHNGKVSQIRSGEIIVSEIFKDHMGKPHVNPKSIKLPEDQRADTEDDVNLLGPESGE